MGSVTKGKNLKKSPDPIWAGRAGQGSHIGELPNDIDIFKTVELLPNTTSYLFEKGKELPFSKVVSAAFNP
jgi:hypothetical protein